MKKLLTISLLLLTSVAFTQTTQGWMYAGGGGELGFTKFSGSGGDDNIRRIGLTPTFGYFFADGMVAGLNLHLSTTRTSASGSSDFF